MEVVKFIRVFNQITDFKPLEELITQLISEKRTFFVYAASLHDETGKSWCDDCDNAKPYIEKGLKYLENQEKVLFLNCVVDRDTWRNKENFYRTHKKLSLKSVPTLVYFDKGVEFGRLQEAEICNDDAIKDFFTNPKF